MTHPLRLLIVIGVLWGSLIATLAPIQVRASAPRQRITPQNVHLLKEINRISGPTPTGLTWSPDGYTLAASTSTDIRLYDTRKPEFSPVIIQSEGGSDSNLIRRVTS